MEYNKAATKLLLILNEVWEKVCGKTIDYDDLVPIVSPETGNTIRTAVPVGCFYPEMTQIYKARTIESLLNKKLFAQAFWQMLDLIINDLLPTNESTILFCKSKIHSQASQEQWRNQIIERIYNILKNLDDQEQMLCIVSKYIKPNNPEPLKQALLQLLR